MTSIIRKIKRILFDFASLLRGKRELSFYFQTLTPLDSLIALRYSLQTLLGIETARIERKKFLEKVKGLYSFEAAFLFGSGRSALYTILSSLNLAQDDEVIITGFTCDVVPNAVIQSGLKPVYADIDPSNYCMSPKSLLKSITKNTKVLVIQHTFGIPADIDALLEIAKKYSLYIIEDCAVSLGTKYRGRLTGTFGDAAIFSFELSKTITSCRGGMLIINRATDNVIEKVEKYYSEKIPEQKRKQKAALLLQLGISGLLYHPRILPFGKYIIAGLFKLNLFEYSTSKEEKLGKKPQNYLNKLSHEQAAMLSRQLDRLPGIIIKSKINVKYYLNQFDYLLSRSFVEYVNANDVNMIRFPLLAGDRDEKIRSLANLNVEVGLWFTAPISSYSTNQELFFYQRGICPVAEAVSSEIINLPVHQRVTDQDRFRMMKGFVQSE